MKDSFLENLVITVVMTVGTKLFSIMWKSAKVEFDKHKQKDSKSTYVKSTVRVQFFTALSLGLLVMILFPLIPEEFKVFAGLAAFASFIAVWGCFDIACEFWINDSVDNTVNKHSDHKSN